MTTRFRASAMSNKAPDNDDKQVADTQVGIQPAAKKEPPTQSEKDAPASEVTEIGGRKGPEPTRYGDWEKNGRCIDF